MVAVNDSPAVAVNGELGNVTSKWSTTLPPPAVTVVVGSDAPGASWKACPPKVVAAVTQVLVPIAHEATALSWTDTASPATRESLLCTARSWITPEALETLQLFPAGGVTGPALIRVKPAGVATLAEPSGCVLSVLFVIVTEAL